MSELVVLTEEPSACDLLEGVLPRILPAHWRFRCIPYEGKQDLERRGPRLIRAWRTPGAFFLILRDQDSGDCRAVKRVLLEKFAGEVERPLMVRIACRELEAWILGDLESFAEEFRAPTAAKAGGQARFRDPDLLGSPVQELRRFAPDYQKRDGARRMGVRLDPGRNLSGSFQAFCSGVLRMVGNRP